MASALAGTLLAAQAWAIEPAEFSRFVQRLEPVCKDQPAAQCVETSWAFADQDGDGVLSLAEMESLRASLIAWVQDENSSLRKKDRSGVLLGLGIVQLVGLPRLYASYDENGDGKLTRSELLADITLDDRPLPKVVKDREAVDWQQLAGRFGATAPLLQSLAPE